MPAADEARATAETERDAALAARDEYRDAKTQAEIDLVAAQAAQKDAERERDRAKAAQTAAETAQATAEAAQATADAETQANIRAFSDQAVYTLHE